MSAHGERLPEFDHQQRARCRVSGALYEQRDGIVRFRCRATALSAQMKTPDITEAAAAEPIPSLDLKAQYRALKTEINAAISSE